MSSGVTILTATVSSAGWYTVATNDNAVSANYQSAFTCVVSVLSGGTQGNQTFNVSADAAGGNCSLALTYGTVGLVITQARIRTSGTSTTNLDIYVNTTTAVDLQIGTGPVLGDWNGVDAVAAVAAGTGTVTATIDMDPGATGLSTILNSFQSQSGTNPTNYGLLSANNTFSGANTFSASNTFTAINFFNKYLYCNTTGAASNTFMVVGMAVNSYAQMQFQGISGATYPDYIEWSRDNSLGYALDIYNLSSGIDLFHVTDAGNAALHGTLSTGSARALKENIKSLESNIMNKIMGLEPISFNYKTSGTQSFGFIAEEVEHLFPELVTKTDKTLGLNYDGLIAPLVFVVQNQQKRILQLETALGEILDRREVLER